MAGHNFVSFIIDFLDIQKHQVCHRHQAVEFFQITRCIPERKGTGIQGTMNAQLLSLGEEGNQKVNLQEGFSSTDSDSPFFAPKSTITEGFF